MRLLKILAAILGMASPAFGAGTYIQGPTISTNTGTVSESFAGTFNLAASSATISTTTISLNGVSGNISASSFTIKGPIPWIDVHAYGAKGDGVTDDGAAISSATSACPISGCVIYFASGTYVTTSANPLVSITVDKRSVWLKGDGISVTTLKQLGTGDVIDMLATTQGYGGEHISDMNISGNGTAARCIDTNGWIEGVIERFNINGCKDNAISLRGSSNYHNIIRDGKISSSANNAVSTAAVSIPTGNHDVVQNVYFNIGGYTAASTSTYQVGLNAVGCAGCVSFANLFDGTTTAIKTNGNFASYGNYMDMTALQYAYWLTANNMFTAIGDYGTIKSGSINAPGISSAYINYIGFNGDLSSQIGGPSGLNVVGTKVGVGTANPNTQFHCSSCTIYVDGNVANGILVGDGLSAYNVAVNGSNAGGAQYQLKNAGTTQANFQISGGNTYLDSTGTFSLRTGGGSGSTIGAWQTDGGYQPFSRTKAQIDGITPIVAGEILRCSDCQGPGATTGAVCNSSGTTLSGFVNISTFPATAGIGIGAIKGCGSGQ